MARKSYPLTLILRAHGPAELLNSNEDIVWASDADDDFREEFNNEFLMEEDLPDILEYLIDTEVLTESEYKKFESEQWDCDIETLDNEASETESEDYDSEDDDEKDD